MTTPPPAAPYGGGPVAGQKKTLSIIALVAGIVGIVLTIFYVGILFDIVAVVLGVLGRKREPYAKGFWMTGLILGIVGIVISIIYFILIAVGISMINNGQIPTN